MNELLWWLVHNHAYVKRLISPFAHQRNMLLESCLPEDEDNINTQYEIMIRGVIITELVSKTLGTINDIELVMEKLDLGEYLT